MHGYIEEVRSSLNKGIIFGVGKGQSLYVPFGYVACPVPISELDHSSVDSEYNYLTSLTSPLLDEKCLHSASVALLSEVKAFIERSYGSRLGAMTPKVTAGLKKWIKSFPTSSDEE